MRPAARPPLCRHRDPSPSSSLFHLITRPGQRPDKLFPEQSARGPSLPRTTAGLLFRCPTKGRRRTDGRTRGRKWKDGSSPASRVSPTVKHSLRKYRRDKASVTRKCRQRTHSATRLQHETCKSQITSVPSNTKAASRAGWGAGLRWLSFVCLGW